MAKTKTQKRKKIQKNWKKFWKLGAEEFNTQYFDLSRDGELTATEGHHVYNINDIAQKYGTPLQIVFPFIIEDRLKDLIGYFQAYIKIYGYKGKFFYHYPMKVNQNKEFIISSFQPFAFRVSIIFSLLNPAFSFSFVNILSFT